VSVGFFLGAKSRAQLLGVHPDLVLVVSRGLLYSRFDFAVNEGLRTKARQEQLVKLGFSKTMNSMHLPQLDGFAHAVDLVAAGDLDEDGDIDAQDQRRTWDPDVYSAIAEAMTKAAMELRIPIRWGGLFKGFFDGPHFELVA
jgi:peptidoglycan L-alanyl-D-glutamate endopeptidase CwlK